MNEKRLTKPNLQIDKTRPTGFRLNQAMPREGCIELNQAYFNGLNTNLRLNYTNGCVELVENINFRYSIIVEDGRSGFYFTCNNHKITGDPEYDGIKVWDSATVRNCQVENYHIGFQVYDNAKVIESLARNNSWGYVAYGFGNITESSAQDNINGGFMLGTRSSAGNSNSRYNGQFGGFIIYGNAKVSNSYASENEGGGFIFWDYGQCEGCSANGNFGDGFYLEDNSRVLSSVSYSNYDWGYRLFTNSRVEDSTAMRNEEDGFKLYDNSSVSGSTSRDNDWWGFWLLRDSLAEDSIAIDNGIDISHSRGFVLYDNARANSVTARNHQYLGFKLLGSSVVTNGNAINNEIGFMVFENALLSQSTAVSNGNTGYVLDESSRLEDSIARYNGRGPGDYGIYLQGLTTATNILSDTNKNGVYVGPNSRLLEGYRICNNDNNNIYVNGGYVEGRFQTGPISGAGNWQNAVIVPCGGGGGSSPLFLKAEQQREIGQSPKNNDWTAIVIAIVALILIFVIYRNFSAYRINRNRMNTKRRR